MKIKTWRISLLVCAFVAVACVPSWAVDKVIVPPTVKSNDELLRILKRLEMLIRQNEDQKPLIAFGRIYMDSTSATDTTIVVTDSFGTVLHFPSVTEWVVGAQFMAHWAGGINYAAHSVVACKPVSDSSFKMLRVYGTYWDTISYIAVGARRKR